MHPDAGSPVWLAQVQEPIIDPDRPIVDPHHHLWRRPGRDYLVEDLWLDTGSGHNVEKTVFVECHAEYRQEGPQHERPLGETEFVAEAARQSKQNTQQASIAGIVGHADLRLPRETLKSLLDQHLALGQGLFRGIRHAGAHALYPEHLVIPGSAPIDLYFDPNYRGGIQLLGEMGLSFDTWHYHYQNRAFIELASACPNTILILDHFGTPLGAPPFNEHRASIFTDWQRDMEDLAKFGHVYAKLGGLAMPDNGFGWSERDTPASSDELVEQQAPYYHHMIDCFGPDRCMFESNFPVDRWSINYHCLYNAFKKLAADYAPKDQDQLFTGTATTVYRLDDS